MVESGDFTLKEAILTIARACENCRNVLHNIYDPFNEYGFVNGYSLLSEEWLTKARKEYCDCVFCKHVTIPKEEKMEKRKYSNNVYINKMISTFKYVSKKIHNFLNKHNKEIKEGYVAQVIGTPLKFEVGRYYKHTTGEKLHICGVAHADIYMSPCYVAEDVYGNFKPVGTTADHAINYMEISRNEFLGLNGGNE
jgi:hypothetical protein